MNNNNILYQFENGFRTKQGVSHWNIGQQLELSYDIETTRHDENINIDYSNVTKKECKSINEVFYIFNEWQKAGYKNIQIITHVKHNDNIIIEDVSECLELSVNNEEMIQLKQENKAHKETQKENELMKDFIKQYNAEKTYDNFVNKRFNNNKDSNGLYWYEMLFRPLSPFCQPKNHIKYDDTKGRHGIIAYDRPLTENELTEYELRPWRIV